MNPIELNFGFDQADLGAVRARVKALGDANAAVKTKTLKSIYFDTAKHALRDAGIELRLRRDGRLWIQSARILRQPNGSLSLIGEIESPAPGGRLHLENIPDISVRDRINDLVKDSPLQPVCEIVAKRTAYEVSLADRSRSELALDIGEVRARDRSSPLREIRIKRLEGRVDGPYDVALALFRDGGLKFSLQSDWARGYLLAEAGWIDPPPAPRNADLLTLDPDESAEQGVQNMLRECFVQIATNMVAVQELNDPEGSHQLRVGLRRLRSAFSAFSPMLNSPETLRLRGEAQWLGKEVGHVRDLDVLLHEIVRREVEANPDEPCLSALTTLLTPRIAEQRNRLRRLLTESRAQVFLVDLARYVEIGGWIVSEEVVRSQPLNVPITEFACDRLNRLWKKLRRHAQGFETLDAERRHELRRELKKLRYVTEFLCSLYPAKRVDPFRKRLMKLQNAFGDLNDALIVQELLGGTAEPGAHDPTTQRAIGWVIGASQARTEFGWARASALLRKLFQARPFWE